MRKTHNNLIEVLRDLQFRINRLAKTCEDDDLLDSLRDERDFILLIIFGSFNG